jgi:hypothetical protein
LETHTRTSTPSSTNEPSDRQAKKETSSAELSSSIAEHGQDGLSPIMNHPRLSGYSSSSRSTSLTTHSHDESNSACPKDSDSLVLTSLGSAAQHQEGLYDLRPTAAAHDSWERSSNSSIPIRPSSSISQPGNTSITLPPLSYTSHCKDPIDLPPNRLFRESTWLPSITHEGIIVSLGGGRVYDRADDVGSSVLLVKHSQSSQASPQPVQSLELTRPPLDRPFQASPPRH